MSVLPVANDKVQLTSSAGTNYQNGVLMSGASAVYATSSPSVWSNGIYRTADGAIYVFNATAGMPSGFTVSNGLPFSALGALCVSTNAVASWSNGIPFDANGAVVADFGMPVPALSLNFTSGTLDSRITFTRASGATYTDSSGAIQLATTNTPRFDYDPVTLAAKGLLIEEQRTNTIRNNSMVGAVAGTPGTLPTNWGYGVLNGLSTSIVATGTDAGVSYVDIRLQGTSSATGLTAIYHEASNFVTAANAQVWSSSEYLKIVSGSLTNITDVIVGIDENNSAGIFLAGSGTTCKSALSSTLSRYTHTRTLNNALTAFTRPYVFVSYNSGVAIDITLRIGYPQLELGAFATSVIPTSGAQATRAADVAVMTGTNFSSWYNSSQGTIFAEFDVIAAPVATSVICSINDGTLSNRINMFTPTSLVLASRIVVSNASVPIPDTTNMGTINTSSKATVSYSATNASSCLKGGTVQTATTSGTPVVNRIEIGAQTSTSYLNGHIKAFAYYNTRLSDAQLQTLTA